MRPSAAATTRCWSIGGLTIAKSVVITRGVISRVGRAWRAAAPLAPLASALVFSRRLLVRPCRLFVSKKTVLPKKKEKEKQ